MVVEHGLFDSIRNLKESLLSREGGLWLAMMCALLFIPLGMAAFFYPVPALATLMAVLAVTGGGFWLSRHRAKLR